MMNRFVIALFTLTLLQGCGGGGSGSSTPPAPQPPTPPAPVPQPATVSLAANGLYLHGELTAAVGESVGFAITTDDQIEITAINWQKTAGPDAIILAAHTQAIGFDALSAGNYDFTVQATLTNNTTRSVNFTLVVADSETVEANIRLDHAATELGRVSLRVDTPATKQVERIQWTHLHGPTGSNIRTQSDEGEDADNIRPQSLFFDAPSVVRDEVIAYQATVTFTDGTQSSDTALVAVDNIVINEDAFFTRNEEYVTSHMLPYRANSPYASALRRCVYNNQFDTSCPFSDIPLLGMQTTTPTVEDVLNRTFVSHPWMGERFEEYLNNSVAKEDMLNLLRGTTAVVISYDIRPSFYSVASGAIYLDANNFWRTPQERDTLNTAPDFRSDFGNDLRFGIFWRYVKDGQSYLNQAFPRAAERGTKPFSGLEASLTWLMYHELAHANDFFPPSRWNNISNSVSPLQYWRNNAPDSKKMAESYPLRSNELKALAQVSFGGQTATEVQRNYTAQAIESFYSPDIAPAYYAYYTEREDYATLFERFMMLYRLEAPADTGILSTNPATSNVTWGVRARINDPALRARLRYTVQRIYPELDFDQIQPSLRETTVFPPNSDWFDLLNLDVPQSERAENHIDRRVNRPEDLGHQKLPHWHNHGDGHLHLHDQDDPLVLPKRRH